MKDAYALPKGPLPPVDIRVPESGKYQPLPEVPGKGKAKVTEEQSDNEEESEKVVLGAKEGGQDEGQARPDPGDAEAKVQSISSPVVHAGSYREYMDLDVANGSPQPSTKQLDEGFTATVYPNIQENLKLAVEEPVLLEEPASSSGTLSSLQHLSRDFSFGDQFFSDKHSNADKNAETKVESMDMAPDEQAQSSDDEDIGSAHIPTVNLMQGWWKPFEEERPTTSEPAWLIRSSDVPTGDIATFMDWFCKRQEITELKPQDLEGPSYEIVKVFHPDMKAVYYPDAGLEQMVPNQFWIEEECKYDIVAIAVRTHMRILSVVRIEVFSMYWYDYMKKIVLRRADLNEHVIAKRDFKKDVDRCNAFMFTIKRRLRTRRIFRNLKSFVGGRVREGDYRLLRRTH
nr:hypothetical protein [Tanacetum cinerariifolium]